MAGPPTHAAARFPTTNWSLVERVRGGDAAEATRAMEELCAQYWYPIYAFVRVSGFAPADAQDLTQVFFQRLISSETIQAAREEKGRLRTFLLSLLKRVIADHRRGLAAQKRGGGSPANVVAIEEAEERYARDLADPRDPDTTFARAWAEGVLAAAEARLREDFVEASDLQTYEQLREFLPLGENATPYCRVAARLGIAEGTLRLQIHRMRKRYARLVEQEIARTVDDPTEVKAELAHLLGSIGK